MPEGAAFEVHADGDVVYVAGEVDVMSVEQLRLVLHRAIEGATSGVTVDLSGVRFIDAAGVGVLVEARNRAVARGKRLAVRRPSRVVLRILEVLGPRVQLETG